VSHIVIIDDEEAVCWTLRQALEKQGHEVATAASAEQGLLLVRQKKPDAVILDVRLPGMDGLTALVKLRPLIGEAPVILITAFGDLNTAVKAVEGGAFDYLVKPFDLRQALDAVERALVRPKPRESRTEGILEPIGSEEIIGRSPAMQGVFKRIALVAPSEACVLITGESGVGKELVARAIHRHSKRADRPFLPVHIAAFNPHLVESELFGHTKGAFTGAAQSRPGLLALANGGTIFLDELADIPLPVQAKLLRVLEHNEVLPVGSNQPQPLDIRILSATHQDLAMKVGQEQFRHDLFYRLNVFQIHVPPLRDRPTDIPLLAEHFLRRFEPRAWPLLEATLHHLASMPWQGNVRELRNALEHGAIVSRGGPILSEHLPVFTVKPMMHKPGEQLAATVRLWLAERLQSLAGSEPSNLYSEMLEHIEPALLEDVMRRVEGNRWLAAKWLGLNRATVRKKLGLYDHLPSQKREDSKAESNKEEP
jgi:two-component system nitrogen regulation response regulator GlnG